MPSNVTPLPKKKRSHHAPRDRRAAEKKSEIIKRRAYRLSEVCALLGISRSTLDRKIKSGAIEVVDFDGTPIVTAATLDKVLGD